MPEGHAQMTRGGAEILTALAWYHDEIDRLTAQAIDRIVANPGEARMYLTIVREHIPKARTLVGERLRPLLLRREQAQRQDDAMADIAARLSAIEDALRQDHPHPSIIPLRREAR